MQNEGKWFSSLIIAFNDQDSYKIQDLINFAINQPASFFKNIDFEYQIQNLNEQNEELYTDISNFLVSLIEWLSINDRNVAFASFYKIIELLGIISKKLDEWFLPILRFLIKKTKKYAIEANKAQTKGGKSNEDNLYKAAETIRGVLSNFQALKSGNSKMMIILFLINELFWIYFKSNNYHQCKSLIQTIESKLNNELSDFSKSEVVNYLYYSGRMFLFESKMKEAHTNLNRAYNLCKNYNGKHHIKIKTQILKYLIPVKIYHGEFPHKDLIETYSLYEYVDLSLSVYLGDIQMFKKQMENLKRLWIKRGLYFFMEKLNLILIRNLFKTSFNIFFKEKNSFMIDTSIFVSALNWKNEEKLSIDEVECIFANLIFKGYIKGYISHEKRKIVLSKKDNDAFPAISDVSKK